MQQTRLSRLIQKSAKSNLFFFSGTWRLQSIALISLLSGYYLASNFSVYLKENAASKIIVVVAMLLIVEIMVRSRNLFSQSKLTLVLKIVDNFRLGLVYAVVLEAFKLGS